MCEVDTVDRCGLLRRHLAMDAAAAGIAVITDGGLRWRRPLCDIACIVAGDGPAGLPLGQDGTAHRTGDKHRTSNLRSDKLCPAWAAVEKDFQDPADGPLIVSEHRAAEGGYLKGKDTTAAPIVFQVGDFSQGGEAGRKDGNLLILVLICSGNAGSAEAGVSSA